MLHEPMAGDLAIERYLRRTGKIAVDDLDWDAAARVGLSDDEVFALTYFADVESQTFRYLTALLAMQPRCEPAVSAFFSSISLSEGLWKRLQAFAVTPEAKTLGPTQARFLSKTLDSF